MTYVNGYKVDDDVQANKVYDGNCPYCGAPLAEDAEVCPYCGRRIKKVDQAKHAANADTTRARTQDRSNAEKQEQATKSQAQAKIAKTGKKNESNEGEAGRGCCSGILVLFVLSVIFFLAVCIAVKISNVGDSSDQEEVVDTEDCYVAVVDVSGEEVTMEVENLSDEKFYFLIVGQTLNGESVDVAGDTYCTDLEPGETVSVLGKFPDEIEEAQIEYLIFKDWEESSEDAYLAEGVINVEGE